MTYPDGVQRLVTAVVDDTITELPIRPSPFNNVWVELSYLRKQRAIDQHNVEVLCRAILELLEGAVDADAGAYGRLIKLARKGGVRLDINPKSGGQVRGREEQEVPQSNGDHSADDGVGGRHQSGSPTGGPELDYRNVHLEQEGRSSSEGTSGNGIHAGTD